MEQRDLCAVIAKERVSSRHNNQSRCMTTRRDQQVREQFRANLKTGRRGETATRNEAMSSFRYRQPVAVGPSKCGEEESDSGRSGPHSVPNPRLAASENQAEGVAKLGGRT